MNTVVKLNTEAMIFWTRMLLTFIAASKKNARAVIIAPIIPPKNSEVYNFYFNAFTF